ncbi:hypothetical protein BFW38_14780 [Terasakiispira papahanaumokuakeensis]|uniref:Nitrite/Sulfite reductase ferredoxin-like domain-containing protein n=1 Tax=Terasakiispira papahanaumokuakeensis TaxID=197479 RepID=A0A1E2VCM6_9GAMM|nr:hypothetical protein [Terasakiispira papahanaumokuakeensis]ODC04602.1 hypothetical protein BFW38_14780 [Terasakiispira papahanaumokuakeensis]
MAEVRGWCPGAWHPMASGDGLVVRIRPRLGRLSVAQGLALCEAAERYADGMLNLTNRANIQLRGVAEADWPKLMVALQAAELVDDDPALESRRNLLVTPNWHTDDWTQPLHQALCEQLSTWPVLPAKVGLALDTGPEALLQQASADIRLELTQAGQLLVRVSGHTQGTVVASVDEAVVLVGRLLAWFASVRQQQSPPVGRFSRLRAALPAWAPVEQAPRAAAAPWVVGADSLKTAGSGTLSCPGILYGAAWGRAPAASVAALLSVHKASLADASTDETSTVEGLRVTPWRQLWVEGVLPQHLPGLILDPADPRLTSDACPGAPYCPQAHIETQPLAAELAVALGGDVHVSGCEKGCARPSAAAYCVVGEAAGYRLIEQGRASDSGQGPFSLDALWQRLSSRC